MSMVTPSVDEQMMSPGKKGVVDMPSVNGSSAQVDVMSSASVSVEDKKDDKDMTLQPPALSINVEKTHQSQIPPPLDEEPPIIKRVPDLSTAPSLRGRMFAEGNMHKCQGVWAMTDAAHTIPGQTSDFEFRIAFTGIPPADLPVDGRYSGWFMIKGPKSTLTRVEDKDMDMKFTKNKDSDDYEVTGSGVNKFGRFSIQGTLKPNFMVQLYKIYIPKKAVGATPRGSTGGSPRPRGTASSNRPLSTSLSSPRESSSRIRRPSLALSESLAPAEKVQKPTPAQRQSSKQSSKQSLGGESSTSIPSSRVPRPASFVNKCKELLKEMMKQVSAIYFAEPVDHVKLGIPDYPQIIKEPMDFGTIRSNLDRQVYKSHEMYAEHMRLVFKNAITYNVRRDNPVHIAARELSDLFEEKYRMMVTTLGANAFQNADEVVPLSRQNSVGGGRKSSGGGRGRGSTNSSNPGPRPLEVTAPPALDSSMQQMMLMHQKMLDMEQELNSLRTAVRQTEIRTSLDQQRVAAQIPLSYDEKKALIENIQRLDGDQIAAVVDIIQSAMPSTDCGGDGEEVEIPMDELDTFTLRQLQDYVHSVQQQAISAKRKRQSMSSSAKSPRSKKSKSAYLRQQQQQLVQPMEEAAPLTIPPPPPSGDSIRIDMADDEDFPAMSLQGRKRSNSLDLFPSDEMEQDPVVNDMLNNDNLGAWTGERNKVVNNESKGVSGTQVNTEGSWKDAVSERKDNLSRQSELQAEGEKLSELRNEAVKLEAEKRARLMQVAKEHQLQAAAKEEEDKKGDLTSQRESERMKREEMSRTVQLDESHDALLYEQSLDL